jgi:hypothetical protein
VTLALSGGGGHKQKVFENRVLRRISAPEIEEITGHKGSFIMRSFIIYVLD